MLPVLNGRQAVDNDAGDEGERQGGLLLPPQARELAEGHHVGLRHDGVRPDAAEVVAPHPGVHHLLVHDLVQDIVVCSV